ncbi:MAG: response regulator [Candidatus Omnitrophica bacterium]|nr:response regulator [Candidatus Omnitrophota bacterium]
MKKSEKLLGEMLVDKGLVTEDDLCSTIAEQYDIEFIKLANIEINWDTSKRFSSSFINKHRCLPLRVDEETVLLAITKPLDPWAVDIIEKEAAPNRIKVVLTKKSDIDTAIQKHQKHSIQKVINKFKENYAAKILVVDDEPVMVRAVEKVLTANNYNVSKAFDGEEGLKKARSENPDLIVLDLMLPKMNGYKICRLLKFDDRYKHIPIVIYTVCGQEEDRKLGFEVGADAYLVKPFEPPVLLAKIEALLKKSAFVS